MQYSVILLTYNHWDLVHRRLFELYRHSNNPMKNLEIVLVDNGSTDLDIRSGLAWWKSTNLFCSVKYLCNEENLSFSTAMNRGAKKASFSNLIFLSNDVIISGNFFSSLGEFLNQYSPCLIGNTLINYDSGWNVFDDTLFPYLEGYFLACTKETFKNLGGFDERYVPYDFEDVDLSTTAYSLGYPVLSLNSSYITHEGSKTIGYNPKRVSITKQNQERFKNKWLK